MVKVILKKLLKNSIVTVRLNGDDLSVGIYYKSVNIWQHTFDLMKDGIQQNRSIK